MYQYAVTSSRSQCGSYIQYMAFERIMLLSFNFKTNLCVAFSEAKFYNGCQHCKAAILFDLYLNEVQDLFLDY